LEFNHDKPYEPVIGYARRPFYTQSIHDRSNLVQSLEDLRTALENQIKEILVMIDKFENDGSDWVLNKPLMLTVRFIRYFDWFNRARGFIETPDWLKNRKAIYY
jgi:hypothetical protein